SVINFFVDDEPACCSATLTCCTHCTESSSNDSDVEVGIFRNDHGIVAPKFEQAATQSGSHRLCNRLAHTCTASSGNQGYAGIGAHPLAHITAAGDESAHTFGNIVFLKNFLHYFLTSHCAQRRFFAGLPDANIAANPGQHAVPAPHSHGEIKG